MLNLKFIPFIFLIFASLLILISCGKEPQPINYGYDECEFCRMLITDNKYGAELVTDKGKIYKFDSIECLVDFSLVENTLGDMKQTLLVTDFYNPEQFIDCRASVYVRNNDFRSPMGLNVSAFKNKTEMQKFISESGGEQLSWIEVIELVKLRSM